MTYMVSTIVLALVDNMGAIIWENNFLMPHEFCLWVDLSATERERLPCVFLIWTIWGTFHARFVTQPTLWAPNISQCGITTRGQWPYYRLLDGIGNNFEHMFELNEL